MSAGLSRYPTLSQTAAVNLVSCWTALSALPYHKRPLSYCLPRHPADVRRYGVAMPCPALPCHAPPTRSPAYRADRRWSGWKPSLSSQNVSTFIQQGHRTYLCSYIAVTAGTDVPMGERSGSQQVLVGGVRTFYASAGWTQHGPCLINRCCALHKRAPGCEVHDQVGVSDVKCQDSVVAMEADLRFSLRGVLGSPQEPRPMR